MCQHKKIITCLSSCFASKQKYAACQSGTNRVPTRPLYSSHISSKKVYQKERYKAGNKVQVEELSELTIRHITSKTRAGTGNCHRKPDNVKACLEQSRKRHTHTPKKEAKIKPLFSLEDNQMKMARKLQVGNRKLRYRI